MFDINVTYSIFANNINTNVSQKKNDISNNCNATWTPSNERKEKPIQCLQITPTSSEWTQLCDVK